MADTLSLPSWNEPQKQTEPSVNPVDPRAHPNRERIPTDSMQGTDGDSLNPGAASRGSGQLPQGHHVGAEITGLRAAGPELGSLENRQGTTRAAGVRRIKGIALRAVPTRDRGFKLLDPSGAHQARPCPPVAPSGRGAGPESCRNGMPEFGKEEETRGPGANCGRTRKPEPERPRRVGTPQEPESEKEKGM